jgi:hypothetical protein
VKRLGAWIFRSVRAAGWAPITVFLLHAVLVATGAYGVYPPLDIPMHLGGGIAIAYFFARTLALAIEADLLGAPNRLAVAVMVVTCTCAAAIAWEFAEWTHDQFFSAGNARGYHDTLLDMALGVFGGALFVAVSAILRSHETRGEPDRVATQPRETVPGTELTDSPYR